jgi:hypothetical protein
VILMFGLLNKGHSDFKKVIEENRKLEKELFSYKSRERDIKLQEEKLRFGLGNYLNDYMYKIKEYLWNKKDVTLTLISAVETMDQLSDEGSIGFWYGVKIIADKDIEVLRIPTFLNRDGCFVSDIAAKRRRTNLLLGTLLSQYIKHYIENDKELTNKVKSIEIKEEINVNKALFNYSVDKEI